MATKYKGLWIGGGLIGGQAHDENFILLADTLTGVAAPTIAQLRADLDFVRGVDGITWTDIEVSLGRDRQGAASKPDYDFTNLGLLFPQNNPTEIAYVITQMQHSKKLGTVIHPHVHYIQDSADLPTFKIDYRWYNNGVEMPGSFTTLSTADGDKGVFDWPGAISMLQIATFPAIAAPAAENVSSNLEFRLYRDDNDVTGDVLTKYVDIHYQLDSLGSDDEYVKQT